MTANPKAHNPEASMQESHDSSLLGGANAIWLESNAHEVPHSQIRSEFRQRALRGYSPAMASGGAVTEQHELKQIYVTQLINAYRVRGHQLAKTDPLGVENTAMVREVRLHENGLSEGDPP